MGILVESVSFRTRWMRTRFPFQYGIAAMTELPHLFVVVEAAVDGRRCRGIASEGLPPKWFTKDPETTFEQDLPGMLGVIRHAAGAAEGRDAESVFAWWQGLYGDQEAWARERAIPPLLAHLGTSLIERAVIDAFCRGAGTTFGRAVHEGLLGFDPGAIHRELAGISAADLLGAPRDRTIARHTVGLGDPLRRKDIAPGEELHDGLPLALEDVVSAYGLTHFKIKLCGDPDRDGPRLMRIAEVLHETSPDFRATLDGNEQYRDMAGFREQWDELRRRPELAELLGPERLLFVEQPLHRDAALDATVAGELEEWADAPRMIIDESDGELGSFARALELGYRGTSHKNCKGVFKGMANACRVAFERRREPATGPVISGEDLANVGPVALLNDLAVMAVLGIEHIERNGHHYFAGLSMFPDELQELVCAAHPDLYTRGPEGFAALRIEEGRIAVGSLLKAPFGHGFDLRQEVLGMLGEEKLPS